MNLIPPAQPDALRPTEREVTDAWSARVQADRAQVQRLREIDDPTDFYAPHAQRFAQDPRRTDEPALDLLLAMVQPGEEWLDIGAGAGRYSLPLALRAGRVRAVDPSPSMLEALRAGMVKYAIANISITDGRWPLADTATPRADVVLMAHIGYDIADFEAFLDAAEGAAVRRCVVIMRAGAATTAGQQLWPEVHGEERIQLPMLPELVSLLMARGSMPEVTLTQRTTWGYDTREALLDASRQQLWVLPGSPKDERLRRLVEERATDREGQWALDWRPVPDGIVTWQPRPAPAS
jgi:SAM-dependent methyltransferase